MTCVQYVAARARAPLRSFDERRVPFIVSPARASAAPVRRPPEPRGVYSKERRCHPLPSFALCLSTVPVTALHFTTRSRYKSYLSPKTNYHYGNSLLSPADGPAQEERRSRSEQRVRAPRMPRSASVSCACVDSNTAACKLQSAAAWQRLLLLLGRQVQRTSEADKRNSSTIRFCLSFGLLPRMIRSRLRRMKLPLSRERGSGNYVQRCFSAEG